MPAPKKGRQGRLKVTGDTHERFRRLHVRQLIDGSPELTPEELAEYDRLAKLPVEQRVCTSPTCAGSCTWRFMPNAATPRPFDD